MKNFNRNIQFAILASAGLGLAACGGGDDTGFLSMQLTDGPVDNASKVVVEVTGVSLQGPGGRQDFTFDTPRSIDLLDLPGNVAEELINDVEVTAGEYQWVRLNVNANETMMDSYVELEDGTQHSLFIPSGDETGLKVNRGFVVPAGGSADFTIDFDVRKSLHQPGSSSIDYILRPTLRLVDNAEVGTVDGTVNASLVTTDCEPAVYLYEGINVTPDDVDGIEPDPVSSAIPAMNADTGNYDYEIGYISQGEYTITYTCDAGIDQPDSDDTLEFLQTQDINVTAGETTTVNFE